MKWARPRGLMIPRAAILSFLKNTFPRNYTLDDFHIVLDCAHGATYKVAPHVFTELGAKVTAIGVEPDGKNINHKCGALHPEVIAEKVKQRGGRYRPCPGRGRRPAHRLR